MSTNKIPEIHKKEQQVVMHSWCVQQEWAAPTITGGQGAQFWDDSGHHYIDMSSLAECSNLGHQHPRVIAAIKAQADQLCFITSEWGAEPRRALAQKLLEVSEFEGGRVFFTLAGADANENAVKFARWASGKAAGAVVARQRSYHGASMATMNFSGDPRGDKYPLTEKVLRVAPPYCYRCPFGFSDANACARECVSDIRAVIEQAGAAEVAAVLMESHAGTNGIVAPADYWSALHGLCAEQDVVLIADEVMAGFGRTGKWFGWQHAGAEFRPDMMTLAKGITGAHIPLGAVVVSADINARLEASMLYTGLTYSGHPLSCAAGLAAVRAYEEEGLIARSHDLGQALFAQLQQLKQRHTIIGDIRGAGLFAVIELVNNRTSREPIVAWGGVNAGLRALVNEARRQGVSFAVRSNLLILAPPLVITETELATALSLLDKLLSQFSATITGTLS